MPWDTKIEKAVLNEVRVAGKNGLFSSQVQARLALDGYRSVDVRCAIVTLCGMDDIELGPDLKLRIYEKPA